MEPTNELASATRLLRRLQARHETERRAARFRPDGKLRPQISGNRHLAERTLVREAIPGGPAELWIAYSGLRESALRMREDPVLMHLTELPGLLDPDALNGYVAFPKRRAPHLPSGTGNLVQYIPVHGGITYACKDSYMAVWGFDTGHFDSDNQPRSDRDWIRANCWVLYRGLLLAEQLSPEFRRATEQRRAALAQQLLDLVEEQPLVEKLGTEAMINMLSGKVG
jgi:hypothetical protein